MTLLVAIVAADPVRRLGLAALVTRAGHQVLESQKGADVVLADDVAVCSDGPPVVALGAAEAGQAGLLPCDATAAQIDAAIRSVAAGLIVRAAYPRRTGFRAIGDEEAPLLTPREIDLAAIGDGLSNKAVARQLGISLHTVKFHVEALLRKLGASSRTEAVHTGLKQGLIEL